MVGIYRLCSVNWVLAEICSVNGQYFTKMISIFPKKMPKQRTLKLSYDKVCAWLLFTIWELHHSAQQNSAAKKPYMSVVNCSIESDDWSQMP